MKKLLRALLFAPLCAFAGEKVGKYQVTGSVAELTDTKIVVIKGAERFDLERNANTKVDGDLKVGAKVTVKYVLSFVMTAATVEVKKK